MIDYETLHEQAKWAEYKLAHPSLKSKIVEGHLQNFYIWRTKRMAQREFDKNNQKDMDDLWCIVPDKVYKISRGICDNDIRLWYNTKGGKTSADCYLCDFLKINWHGETEITRPVNYEDMIGCVGWFWDDKIENRMLGTLRKYHSGDGFAFYNEDNCFKNFRPAKKSELKFWEEEEQAPYNYMVENIELKECLKKTQELELEVRRENAQLKELLRECRDRVKDYRNMFSNKKTFGDLLAKINQALGENE